MSLHPLFNDIQCPKCGFKCSSLEVASLGMCLLCDELDLERREEEREKLMEAYDKMEREVD